MAPHALAICAFSIQARPGQGEIQLFPAGHFRAIDGRPHEADAWYIDAAIARQLIEHARARQTPFVIDYEHQTLNSVENGQPAPAAGWFSTLEWREGDGLYATDVEWTARAREHIGNDEYRFISPVFPYDPKTGAVLGLYHVALTNDPALDGMAQVMAAARRQFLSSEEDSTVLKKLIEKLGLKSETTEDQALEAAAALKARADENADLVAALRAELELDDDVTADDMKEAIATLKTERDEANQQIAALKADPKAKGKGGNPDPSKYVPVETVEALKKDIADLREKQVVGEVDEIVTAALKDGRLLPAQEQWARDLGKENLAALKKYVENAQPIAALKGSQTGGKQPTDGKGNAVLTDQQKAVCRNLGMSEEEYAKGLSVSEDA